MTRGPCALRNSLEELRWWGRGGTLVTRRSRLEGVSTLLQLGWLFGNVSLAVL
jgi:hypothetical protein